MLLYPIIIAANDLQLTLGLVTNEGLRFIVFYLCYGATVTVTASLVALSVQLTV
jgi:hypothetical protein